LKAVFFINSGDGTFEIKKLPVEAQFSPVRGILADDIDKDGKTDLLLVGNDYTAKPSMGRYDASYGWCLLGGPASGFSSLMRMKADLRYRGCEKSAVFKDKRKKICISRGE